MKITPFNRVYVATHLRDLRLARISVASVRYYYPQIPLSIIVDEQSGACDVTDICRTWGADVFRGPTRNYGWGFSKLEPLFLNNNERFLILDSDTVFAGPVLDRLQCYDEDFLVPEEHYPDGYLRRLFVDWDNLKKYDTQAIKPRFAFNSGQWVGRGGVIGREAFMPYLNFSSPRTCKYPQSFFPGEQGVLNYVVNKLYVSNAVSVKRLPMHRWPREATDDINLETIKRDASHPAAIIIHWAGIKTRFLRQMPRYDILNFFEKYYYGRAGISAKVCDITREYCRRLAHKLGLKIGDLRAALFPGNSK